MVVLELALVVTVYLYGTRFGIDGFLGKSCCNETSRCSLCFPHNKTNAKGFSYSSYPIALNSNDVGPFVCVWKVFGDLFYKILRHLPQIKQ